MRSYTKKKNKGITITYACVKCKVAFTISSKDQFPKKPNVTHKCDIKDHVKKEVGTYLNQTDYKAV